MNESTRHPSHGVILASRWHAGGRGMCLFGSKLPGHNSGISLTIKEGTADFSHGEERIHGVGGKVIAQVRLSSVQWAELLTTMSMGDGVPCTIVHALGDTASRGDPPAVDSEPERVRTEVASKLRGKALRLRETRQGLAAKLKGKVSAAVAKEIDDVLGSVEQDLSDNIPWYTEMFAEATDRIVVGAKAEVEAFLSGAAHRLGVKALEMGGVRALLSDGGGE